MLLVYLLGERRVFSSVNANQDIAGIFFVLPCVETYQKVDLRTITLGVPPQEVSHSDGGSGGGGSAFIFKHGSGILRID